MNTTHQLSDFDSIRPYADEEIGQAINALLGDRQFNAILKGFAPWLPSKMLGSTLRLFTRGLHSSEDFQMRIMKPVVRFLLRRTTSSYTFHHEGIEPGEGRYTFVSNHRDIVMDSAILAVMLNEAKFPTTCEIAIGDNLIIYPWIRTLVRLNKSFLVQRSLPRREALAASQLMSEYMHYVINVKHDNIWIAQREGRAKDSDDRTQVGLVRMMAMGGEGSSAAESLGELSIVPLAISYEYDPCDYLKAKEFQQRRDIPGWKKSRQDDLLSMRTGIMGRKGQVVYRTAPVANTWLPETEGLPKAEVFPTIASRIDREIHRRYELFTTNYIADDLLTGVPRHAEMYTHAQMKDFERYLASRVALVSFPHVEGQPSLLPDEAFLRQAMLTMYANPLRNKEAATEG